MTDPEAEGAVLYVGQAAAQALQAIMPEDAGVVETHIRNHLESLLTAYWILWSAGSALMSILGVLYESRSLVATTETLKERDSVWVHSFASDLDCLDQYNYCACEVVVTNPIANLDAMWEILETERLRPGRRTSCR